jgi:uncharacterized protein (TIGR00369 family)
MQVVRADVDGSDFQLRIDDSHLQAYGTAHGGILAGLLDAAMGLAVLGRLPDGETCATIEMKVNFLAPCSPGDVRATGRVISQGRRLVLASAECKDTSDRLLAFGTGTFLRSGEPR